MPVLEGRDGVLGVVPDGPEFEPWWACPKPDCTAPHSEPGDCPEHWIPLVEIGPDDMEVA